MPIRYMRILIHPNQLDMYQRIHRRYTEATVEPCEGLDTTVPLLPRSSPGKFYDEAPLFQFGEDHIAVISLDLQHAIFYSTT